MPSMVNSALMNLLLVVGNFELALPTRMVNMREPHTVPPMVAMNEEPTVSMESTSPMTTTVRTTMRTTKLPWPDLSCDFDSSTTCNWKNPRNHHDMDDFDWKLGKGRAAHRRRTGTKDDHGGGGGYLYIKSGSNRNRTAKMVSIFIKLQKPGCLKFWYHMRGRHMGHLKLFESRDLKGQLPLNIISIHKEVELPPYTPVETMTYRPLWEIYGSQGSEWKEGVVPIAKSSYRKILVFEAFDWDGGRQGNILLDDITFAPVENKAECALSPAEAEPPVKVAPTTTKKTTAPTPSTVDTTATLSKTEPKPDETIATRPLGPSTTSTLKAIASTTTTASTTAISIKPSMQTSGKSTKTHSVAENDATAPHAGMAVAGDLAKIYAAVAVVAIFLVLGVSLLFFVLYKRRRRLSYYDNCTVAMTRMAPEIVKVTDHTMEYRKLM